MKAGFLDLVGNQKLPEPKASSICMFFVCSERVHMYPCRAYMCQHSLQDQIAAPSGPMESLEAGYIVLKHTYNPYKSTPVRQGCAPRVVGGHRNFGSKGTGAA